jgi:hypothetical protein
MSTSLAAWPLLPAFFDGIDLDQRQICLKGVVMSALGQKQTSDWRKLTSALPPKADIADHDPDVCFVPILLQKAAITDASSLNARF